MLTFSKVYCCPSFHPIWTNFIESMVGRIQAITFLAICQILKIYGTLKITYLSYIASIHKSMLVSFDIWSSRASRPLALSFTLKLDWPSPLPLRCIRGWNEKSQNCTLVNGNVLESLSLYGVKTFSTPAEPCVKIFQQKTLIEPREAFLSNMDRDRALGMLQTGKTQSKVCFNIWCESEYHYCLFIYLFIYLHKSYKNIQQIQGGKVTQN